MPEFPEVEVVRAGLEPAVVNARVLSVDVWDERALTRHVGDGAGFSAALTGRVMSAVARRGKFLWLTLADDDSAGNEGVGQAGSVAVLAHLGMSGQLLLREPDAPRERHERIRIILDHPQRGELAVVFADQRTFGSLAIDILIPTPDQAPGGFGSALPAIPGQAAHIARDPLDDAFDVGPVIERIRQSNSAIKRMLLNQNLVSGIGNIYADEALWVAGIHPESPGNKLTPGELHELFDQVRAVFDRALAEGGTSFDAQYLNVNGQAGYFSRSLHVYGRQGKPCDRCGTSIVRESFMNRGSHFCPRCQRQR